MRLVNDNYDPKTDTITRNVRFARAYCEQTVIKDGQPQACNRPLDERGYCDRPSDHVEES